MEELLETSMSMITYAGDARDMIQKALIKLESNEIEESDQLMNEAFENIKIAHIKQAKVIQNAMAMEDDKSADLLFNHAQDTLMTINSEFNVAKQLIYLYKKIDQRMSILEEKLNEAVK